MNTPRTVLLKPPSNSLRSTRMCATSLGELDANDSSQVTVRLLAAMLAS